MSRLILWAHRSLGVGVGALMTVWCLSGFVMMYVDYPRLTPKEQLQGLRALQRPVSQTLHGLDIPPDTQLASARLEMVGGRLVLRTTPAMDPSRPIVQTRATPAAYDVGAGQPLAPLSRAHAGEVAKDFAEGLGLSSPPPAVAPAGVDQWNVQAFRSNQPLYRARFDDAGGTTIYIAAATGEVVQQTTRRERFWGWLGAVPHWLYPTVLRQDGALWSQAVVWTSLAGCFLATTGIWAGISRLRRDRQGRLGSPFRGVWWWHHTYGLFFGVLALTWVASGVLSMNPWGFLDSMAGVAERQRLAGAMTWAQARDALVGQRGLPPDTVRLEAAPLGGRTFVVATSASGRQTRHDAAGATARLGEPELRRALSSGPPVASLTLLQAEDAYYYRHKSELALPVWRAVLEDAEGTRLYIDADSGRLIRAVDRNGRTFRWVQSGLHSLDLPILRTRPLWDLVVLVLLAAVTIVCATGTWMGVHKVGRDLGVLTGKAASGAP